MTATSQPTQQNATENRRKGGRFFSPITLLDVIHEIEVPLCDALHGSVTSGRQRVEQVERVAELPEFDVHPLGDCPIFR
jgi:hypothetical protein